MYIGVLPRMSGPQELKLQTVVSTAFTDYNKCYNASVTDS